MEFFRVLGFVGLGPMKYSCRKLYYSLVSAFLSSKAAHEDENATGKAIAKVLSLSSPY